MFVQKIRDLDKVYDKLTKLVPEISIVIAHGKMTAAELDQIMIDFCDGKYHLYFQQLLSNQELIFILLIQL